ncbi:hypothetical protein pb186bvf_001496 [Paramecium bursaria]
MIRNQKLQQFFQKSNIYLNTSQQQIQKLTISNESKIKEVSQDDSAMKQVVRPYQTEFDAEMCNNKQPIVDLMAKPLIQPHLNINILSKPEIKAQTHSISAQMHKDIDQIIKRSENLVIEKYQSSSQNEKIFNDKYLKELRAINQTQGKQSFLENKAKKETPQVKQIELEKNNNDKEYDFKTINRKKSKDHAEFLKLPSKIQEIHKLNTEENALDETFILHDQKQQKDIFNEKINFESIISIAGGNIDEMALQELVKNVQIAKRKQQIHDVKYDIKQPEEQMFIDRQVSARQILIDQSMQMSEPEQPRPNLQNVLNGIRLAKNRYYIGDYDERSQFKMILKNHLNDLLSLLMLKQPFQSSNISDCVNYLLSLKKSDLSAPIDGMTKLELLYIFLNEYKSFQQIDNHKSVKSQSSVQTVKKKRYMQATQVSTLKKKH